MLLHAAGKEISEENLKKVLQAAGINPDETRIKALTSALEGVNIDEALSQGAFIAPSPAPAVQERKEEKKEEKKKKEEEKVSEEEAAAGLSALFGL